MVAAKDVDATAWEEAVLQQGLASAHSTVILVQFPAHQCQKDAILTDPRVPHSD